MQFILVLLCGRKTIEQKVRRRRAEMLEIILLLVLSGIIGDMARRRRRSPSLFGWLLIVCWFGGEIAGAVPGYTHAAGAAAGKLASRLSA
jgi:hypothetical protein